MKHSTIKKVIRKKLDGWIATITDDGLKAVIRENAIVSGGCITSILLDEKMNDYDIYFRTKEAAIAVAEYYVKVFNASEGRLATTASKGCNPVVKTISRQNIRGAWEERVVVWMQSAGVASEGQSAYHYFEGRTDGEVDDFVSSLSSENPGEGMEGEIENDSASDTIIANIEADPMRFAQEIALDLRDKELKYKPIFFTENAITLSGKIQLVTRFYGQPSEIHDNYDFVHCMCYYDLAADELSTPHEALQSILSKALIYKGSLYPVASVFRIRKFIQRGWRITAGQTLKIIMQLSKLDLNNFNVLKDQLIGVDAAYMSQLLGALQASDKERIDDVYLAKIIDEIFE